MVLADDLGRANLLRDSKKDLDTLIKILRKKSQRQLSFGRKLYIFTDRKLQVL
jgi:hypothetical protein